MRRDLPTGTVTFLFTDVEGSTKLLHELGAEGYAEVLAEHRRSLREVCSAHGGVEVDAQGDAFFAAFPTAPSAVRAASEALTLLAAGQMRVRIGIHTGTPHVSAEGYVGMDVHRAARIAASGHGGQVLVSAATAALLGAAELRYLGEHRLKDLSAPERIYQLGDAAFPPLQSGNQTNLPIPSTPFLGRQRELAEVHGLLLRKDIRLLTLTGAGGTGKTRLALQAAATLGARYPSGIWWVPLASLRDPKLVLETAAQALGAKTALAEHVAERSMLLLFDNFEQVVEAAAELAGLLAACPNLDLLVTSRQRLRVGGEQTYPVPPLAESDGAALFVARARAVDPSFAESKAVGELCGRLDELPLAIELAAARTALFGPEQLLERLSQRLDLLKGGRDADPRQRTLRATIEWSYDLLTEAEQELLGRLSVFAGGCSYEAAEDVAGADPDTLQSLLDKSLLRRRDWEMSPRYSMLETIRDFAGERLEDRGAAEGLRRRHALYFVTFTGGTEQNPSGVRRPVGELRADLDNFRIALAWLRQSSARELELKLAISLFDLWIIGGYASEGRSAVEGALAGSTQHPAGMGARALQITGDLALEQGDYAAANEHLEHALDLFRQLRLERSIASCLTDLGHVAKCQRKYARAEALLEESIESARGLETPSVLASALLNLGDALVAKGDDARAEAVCEESLQLFQALGDSLSVGICQFSLGLARFHRGLQEAASEMYKRALTVFWEFEYAVGIGCSFEGLAGVAAVDGRVEEAARLLGAAEALFESAGAKLEPGERDLHDSTVDALRAELRETGLEQLWANGKTMRLQDAVAYAVRAGG